MSQFYNTSTIAYDSATTPYDGSATVFTYAGNIPLNLIPSHSYYDGAYNTYFYAGRLVIEMSIEDTFWGRGIVRWPTYGGLTLRLVPNSSMLIKQYYKTVKDPQVTGGCPNCGTYVYNQ